MATKMTFSYEWTRDPDWGPGPINTELDTDITYTIGESDLPSVLIAVQRFLAACGYVFEVNDALEVVNHDSDYDAADEPDDGDEGDDDEPPINGNVNDPTATHTPGSGGF